MNTWQISLSIPQERPDPDLFQSRVGAHHFHVPAGLHHLAYSQLDRIVDETETFFTEGTGTQLLRRQVTTTPTKTASNESRCATALVALVITAVGLSLRPRRRKSSSATCLFCMWYQSGCAKIVMVDCNIIDGLKIITCSLQWQSQKSIS
jgi:hypothetical protein